MLFKHVAEEARIKAAYTRRGIRPARFKQRGTVFNSVFDPRLRQRIAQEMLRVLKAGGAILWLDFIFNNPANPDVQGIRLKQIRYLFPNCDLKVRRITWAPPLARCIAPLSWLLCYLLARLKFLNTHCLGLICKKSLNSFS
jgi:hypothetical protein